MSKNDKNSDYFECTNILCFGKLPIQMHTSAYHVVLLARKKAMTTALANHDRVFHVLSRERKGCLIPKISHLYDFALTVVYVALLEF